MEWECGECGTVAEFEPGFDGEMPDGWFRLEDERCVYVCCSSKCLHGLAASITPCPSCATLREELEKLRLDVSFHAMMTARKDEEDGVLSINEQLAKAREELAQLRHGLEQAVRGMLSRDRQGVLWCDACEVADGHDDRCIIAELSALLVQGAVIVESETEEELKRRVLRVYPVGVLRQGATREHPRWR